DYDEVRKKAKETNPKIIIAGASAYPREIDFKKFREIADETGALLLADAAHYAGLIAAGLYPDPVPYCDFVTTTTHKTLKGPRGGLILCREKFAKQIDSAVFPVIQGCPFMHIIAAKAICFKQAMTEDFKEYQKQVIENARTLAGALVEKGYKVLTGGTDCHMILIDLRDRGITGKDAAAALEKAGITVNKNGVPFDDQSPFITSGIRIGTPAVTARGMKTGEMKQIASWMDEALKNSGSGDKLGELKKNAAELCGNFPVYE
ncbi:MAG: serine hydroxymethyltransferase, partial [bacterium]